MRPTTLPTRSLALLVLVLALSSHLVNGQEKAPDVTGGSFMMGEKEVTVPAEEIAHHYAFIKGRNKDVPHDRAYELAWARVIRLRLARAAGITVDRDDLQEWMQKQHVSLRIEWLDEQGRIDPARLKAYLARFGCETLEEYEEYCREEYLGELWVTRDDTPDVFSEEEVRKRFDSLNQRIVVRGLVISPETIDRMPEMDKENPEHRKLFAEWWDSLSDQAKKVYDDRDRPAIEAEVIYVRFDEHTVESFKEFFESRRPGLGKSLDELTTHFALSELERTKLIRRWIDKRRNAHAWAARSLEPGLNDKESYEKIEPHLVREWRVIKHLGEVWNEIAESHDAVDMRKLAEQRGLLYRYVPLTPSRELQSIKSGLPGDHPLYMQKSGPGDLFRYRTSPENAANYYFVDGVFDQPGYHASIWRVVKTEGMRVLPAEEAIDKAWHDFEPAVHWQLAEGEAKRFVEIFGNKVQAYLGERERTIEAMSEGRRATFNAAVDEAKIGKFIGPFHLRPFRVVLQQPLYKGSLGRRLDNLLNNRWPYIAGSAGTIFEKGTVTAPYRDAKRQIHVVFVVEEAHLPDDEIWQRNAAMRTEARRSLEADARRDRRAQTRREWSWPAITLTHKIRSPHFEKVMGDARILGKNR